VVRTNTPALRAQRKLIIELLFAERNHVCSVCVLNGACELQELAAELGVDHIRLKPQYPKLAMDLSHDRFGLDHNRCILCTRCVRVCDEVEGAHTWDVAGRGRNSLVISDLGEPWGESESCTSCGKCVQVCPTGALFSKGKTVAEMRKDRSFLRYIVTAREQKLWIK
jgi:bidirectional [NiFe] hydrogenase diaphorase subunit